MGDRRIPGRGSTPLPGCPAAGVPTPEVDQMRAAKSEPGSAFEFPSGTCPQSSNSMAIDEGAANLLVGLAPGAAAAPGFCHGLDALSAAADNVDSRPNKPKSAKRKSKRAAEPDGERRCHSCGATETPKWRCGMTLCNACGLRNAKRSPRTRNYGSSGCGAPVHWMTTDPVDFTIPDGLPMLPPGGVRVRGARIAGMPVAAPAAPPALAPC